MKKIIVIIAVLAVIFGISPYFIGSKAEQVFSDQITKLNQHPNMSIKIDEYHRGWFSSTAKVTMSVELSPELAASGVDFALGMDHFIQHGPILTKVNGIGFGLADTLVDFTLPAEIQSELDKLEAINKETLSVASRTSFSLASTTYLDLKAFQIKEQDTLIDVKAGDGEFSFTQSGKVAGRIDWAGMSITDVNDTQKSVHIKKIAINSEQQLELGELFSPAAIYSGFLKMQVERIEFNDAADMSVNFDNIGVSFVSELEADLANLMLIGEIKAFEIANAQYTDYFFNLSFEKFDAKVLQQLNQLMVESQTATDPNPMLFATQVQALLPQLLAKNPEVKINELSVTTPQGDVKTDMVIKIDPTIYDVSNPMTMLMAIDAASKGFAPEAFLIGLGMQAEISQLIEMGMLVKEDKNLKFDFNFKNGQATMNGNPMPLGF
ncbi:YdgA family protein [Aliikangiella sp. IMCC44653]